jgi:hypothetical protein
MSARYALNAWNNALNGEFSCPVAKRVHIFVFIGGAF